MKAKEIMRRKVITIVPQMTVAEAAGLFTDRRISGAPVVDPDGKLLGVLSQSDLVRHERESPREEVRVPSYYTEAMEPCPRGYQIQSPDYTRVGEIMTPAVLSAEEDAPVESLARTMLRRKVHRIVITKMGRLAGIVSTMDLLKALLRNGKGRRR